jgi:CTP synthase
MSMKVGQENCLFVHVVYMPYLGASAEFKTKPAQNAVRELRGLGNCPGCAGCEVRSNAAKISHTKTQYVHRGR